MALLPRSHFWECTRECHSFECRSSIVCVGRYVSEARSKNTTLLPLPQAALIYKGRINSRNIHKMGTYIHSNTFLGGKPLKLNLSFYCHRENASNTLFECFLVQKWFLFINELSKVKIMENGWIHKKIQTKNQLIFLRKPGHRRLLFLLSTGSFVML